MSNTDLIPNFKETEKQKEQDRSSRSYRYELLISFLVFIFTFIAYSYGFFEGFEARLIDHRLMQRKLVDQFEKIAVVEVTDSCLSKISGWPVSRSVIADGVDRVMNGGARALAIDMLFDGKTQERDDVKLAETIKKHARNIVLVSKIEDIRTIDDARNIVTTRRTAIPYLAEDARWNETPFTMALMNIRMPENSPDSTVRDVLLHLPPAEGLTSGAHAPAGRLNVLGLEAHRIYSGAPSSAEVGLADGSYRNHLFVSYYNAFVKSPFVKVALSDLLAMDTDEVGDILKGKLVFMGVTANTAGDFYMTPYGDMPGVEIHATIAANIMEGRIARRITAARNFLILFIAMIIIHFYMKTIRVWFDIFAVMAVLLADYYVAVWFTTAHNVFTDVVPLAVQIVFHITAFRLYQNVRMLYLLNIELGSRNKELSLMDLINHAIINKTGGELLCEILNIVVTSIRSERSSIMMMAENENKLMLKYVFSNRDAAPVMVKEYISFNVGEGIAGTVAERGDMLISNNVRDDERFKMYSQAEMNKTVDNLACIALKSDKEIFGVLNIVNKPGGFTEDDMLLLQNIADQVAVALQNAKFYELAITDGMTKLYIRRYFRARLESEIKRAKRFNLKLAIMMFDIDHFKKFNDTYGHQVGDMVIIHVAQKFVENIRMNLDIPSRYGGEEYVLLMPETDINGANILAERIRNSIAESSVEHEGMQLRVTISVGVAEFPPEGITSDDFIKRADSALYASKKNGRNQTTLWVPAIGYVAE